MAVRLTIRPSEHGFARLTPAVLFKVKVNRWRGAVHESADPSWLAAVGLREDGSQDDCYKAFANAARARHNVEHRNALSSDIFCCGWLPDDDDHDRYRVEAGIRLLGELRSTCGGARRCRVAAHKPVNVLMVILDLVPGCDKDSWYPEFAMPHRPLAPGEQVYSNYMDPSAAAKLLEDQDQ